MCSSWSSWAVVVDDIISAAITNARSAMKITLWEERLALSNHAPNFKHTKTRMWDLKLVQLIKDQDILCNSLIIIEAEGPFFLVFILYKVVKVLFCWIPKKSEGKLFIFLWIFIISSIKIVFTLLKNPRNWFDHNEAKDCKQPPNFTAPQLVKINNKHNGCTPLTKS